MSNVAMLITVNNPGTHSPQLANRTALPSRSLDSSANRKSLAEEQCGHLLELISAPPGCRIECHFALGLRGQQCLFARGRRRIKKILSDKSGHALFLFIILVEKGSFRNSVEAWLLLSLGRLACRVRGECWASKTGWCGDMKAAFCLPLSLNSPAH